MKRTIACLVLLVLVAACGARVTDEQRATAGGAGGAGASSGTASNAATGPTGAGTSGGTGPASGNETGAAGGGGGGTATTLAAGGNGGATHVGVPARTIKPRPGTNPSGPGSRRFPGATCRGPAILAHP